MTKLKNPKMINNRIWTILVFGFILLECTNGEKTWVAINQPFQEERLVFDPMTTTKNPSTQVVTESSSPNDFPIEHDLHNSPINVQRVGHNESLVEHHLDNSPVNTDTSESHDDDYDADDSHCLSKVVLQMAQELVKSFTRTESITRTEVISPTSIVGALLLAMLGSNNETYQQFTQLFHYNNHRALLRNSYVLHKEFSLLFNDVVINAQKSILERPSSPWRYGTHRYMNRPQKAVQDTSDHKIRVANGIFVNENFPLRPDYKTAVKSVYKSTIKSLNFRTGSEASRMFINNWVNNKTHGRIKEILSAPITSDTDIIITSALYFKGLWERPFFERGATQLRDFYPEGLENPPIQTLMMATGGLFPYYDAKEYDCQIFGLPYRGNLTTMYIIIPNNSSRTKLRNAQASLDADKIEDMISKMELKTIAMIFPKMRIRNSRNLRNTFIEMGLRNIFNSQRSDLSLISEGYKENVESDTDDNNEEEDDEQISITSENPHGTRIDSDGGDITTIQPDPNKEKVNVTQIMTPESQKVATLDELYANRSNNRQEGDLISGHTSNYPSWEPYIQRHRRDTDIQTSPLDSIKNLDRLRNSQNLKNPRLYADEIVHKIDLTVNEKGTEGGAATAISLRRSGTDVVIRTETPFMFIIRHDPTRMPLFYGVVYEPTYEE